MTTGEKARIADSELRLMNAQGWSPAQLGIHFGTCPATVERRLRRLGLELHEGRSQKGDGRR
jgi:hypothetical protein